MIDKLECAKEKIMRGTISEADIDILNDVIEYINTLAQQTELLPEPALMQDDMLTGYTIIENVTININTHSNDMAKKHI